MSCFREEFYPTVTTAQERMMDALHHTWHVLTAISTAQRYSSSLEPLYSCYRYNDGSTPLHWACSYTTRRTLLSCYWSTTVPQVSLGVSLALHCPKGGRINKSLYRQTIYKRAYNAQSLCIDFEF